jgi:TolB-like protein/Tfp pilus assembly protein PilF
MPFIDGESLRERLNRDGRLPLSDTIGIARDVASVLAYAHEQDVVHRDIKPENIMLSRGQALVADFGIARAVSAAGGERITATGLSLGTPAYMSPEQALGEDTVDGRSDIYSLGCVIYEMISGDVPFVAPTVQALIARRLSEPPPVLAGAPADVASAVRRSMATEPSERFATAAELARALVEHATVEQATEDASVVVLPFENRSPDPDNAYFADGLTEEIISDLSQIRGLRVISRTSAMRYRDSEKDLPTIARELRVRYVLEGSVRRAGTAIRVTSQLIEADSDAHVWSGKFGGSVEDVFEIQEQLSRDIVEALKVTLSPEESNRLAARKADSPQALDLYLRVRHEIWSATPDSLRRARDLVDTAADLVDESALLLAARANVLFQTLNLGVEIDEALAVEAEALSRRAIAIDPSCAQAHSVLAWILGSRGRMREAIPPSLRAYELDPRDTEVVTAYTFVALFTGARPPSDVERAAQEAISRDPMSALSHLSLGVVAFFQGDFTAALTSYRQGAKLDQAPVWRFMVAIALLELGRNDDAEETLASIAEAKEQSTWHRLGALLWHAIRGEEDEARSAVDDALIAWATPDPQYSWHLAQAYAQLGDLDQAYAWIERAVNLQLINYPFLANHDRLLDPLREDGRFVALLERVHAAWERGGATDE